MIACNWSADVRPMKQLDRPGVKTPRAVSGHFVCDLSVETCVVCGRSFEALLPPRPLFPVEEDLGDGETCPPVWLIDGREPFGWQAHRKALVAERNTLERADRYVTLDAVKKFLKSGASWGEFLGSGLLGVCPVSGYTRLGASCPKGHPLRSEKSKCKTCTKERVRKYRERRRKMLAQG